ncbi:MAG: N-acetyltransferase, partial [Thiogranum sp.]|nr:N-acetyltransferase [Thiogranum sp.]
MPDDTHDLTVCEVTDRKQLAHFIRFPRTLYKDDPNWVCPLFFEQKERFSIKNPFFQHARWQAWIAHRNNRPVGRICAQIDDLHLKKFQDSTGHFGCLEAEDDPQVFSALFETAQSWLRAAGMTRVTGPFNLSINEECG